MLLSRLRLAAARPSLQRCAPSHLQPASKRPRPLQHTRSSFLLRARRPGLLLARRALFIQTEGTPNPDSLKFLPGKPLLDSGTADFRTEEEGKVSPLAKRLFNLSGVNGVFFASDFLTVSKSEDSDWTTLKPQIFEQIMDFYSAGEPLFSEGNEHKDSLEINDDDSEVVQMIKELLELRIRPSVQEDGGDIVFKDFDEESGVVYLTMQGSCSGCPSSSVTLKSGIENMLMHYIPEVTEVKAAGEEEDDDEDDDLMHRILTSSQKR